MANSDGSFSFSGKLSFWGVKKSVPSGTPLSRSQHIEVELTLTAPEDEEILQRHGVAGLRRHRLKRLVAEANQAGATLTYEDLANILTCSLSTICRDIAELHRKGEFVGTRGQIKNIGRCRVSRLEILRLLLEGASEHEAAARYGWDLKNVRRLYHRFQQAVQLYNKKMPVPKIAKITRLSPSLLMNYFNLAGQYNLIDETARAELPSAVDN
ncbi:MAG: DUF1670 domain-containing protein [Firmicutes bacterium]|nr:DUF1670 domain-containing protein [Bacillota bacterium]